MYIEPSLVRLHRVDGVRFNGGAETLIDTALCPRKFRTYRSNFLRTRLMRYGCIHLQTTRHSVTLIVHNTPAKLRRDYITNYTLLRA